MIFANGGRVVLDPNVKLAYAEDKWDAEKLEEAIGRLETVVRVPALISFPYFLPRS